MNLPESEVRRLIGLGAVVKDHAVRVAAPPVISLETRMAWTEKQFQSEVVKLAKENGWLCYHTWLSIRSEPGFPDLVLVRGRTIFAELKKQKGKETPEQKQWRRALVLAQQDCRLWRPSDWEEIVAALAP